MTPEIPCSDAGRETAAVNPLPPSAKPGRNVIAAAFFGLLALSSVVYVLLGLTPSSYGVALTRLGAREQGPIFGTPRPIRSDEWAVLTPLVQAAVRNGFAEINQTSLYREDLRSFLPVPLKNWSLAFRPQFWAFFVTDPATAYSVCFAFLFCASLAGYYLFFRQLGAGEVLAVAGAVTIFFSGLIQFMGLWWLAGVPWVLAILLRPMAWWRKALLLTWLMPATALAFPYPPYFTSLALIALLLLAIRRDWFRSPGEIAAVAAGTMVTACVLYGYFARLLPAMLHTVYPGQRIAPPGTVPVAAVWSQMLPFLALSLSRFGNLVGENVCEIGTIGSFLPLLTLCLLRYRAFWNHRTVRNAVFVLLAAAAAMAMWQVAPAPLWIGSVMQWNSSNPARLFLSTGILVTVAGVLVWSNGLISARPGRMLLFLLLGPIASVILKCALFRLDLTGCAHDLAVLGLAVCACAAACLLPAARRGAVLLAMVALINTVEFGRFNPLQPAEPIFNPPETPVTEWLRRQEASTPGRVLVDDHLTGAVANGLGFRSVAHVLPAPQLDFFRRYFPAMDPARFNQTFNRYAHIQVGDDPLPHTPRPDVIRVPREVFVPIRNARQASVAAPGADRASLPFGGGLERMTRVSTQLTLEGWAPWRGEDAAQGLRIFSSQAIRVEALRTVSRPDMAEVLRDYAYGKAGFQLRLSSTDGRPIRPEELLLVAHGTAQGDVRLQH